MRGVSLASFMGPVASARNSWLPPTPSMGRIATASTRMPMPPSHCRKQRQRLMEPGSRSSPTSTVAPVVVSPEMASKYASVNDSGVLVGPKYSSKGTQANSGSSVQANPTSRMPSRFCSSSLCPTRQTAERMSAPHTKVRAMAPGKAELAPSCVHSDTPRGTSMVRANTMTITPRTGKTRRKGMKGLTG
ncbi:MAG: hypothetical protein A3G82_14935 [Burkholderiales bacterium RIFCSPLOWO2_12_FULL_67_210]|nr:MAG: hypothetical protein A3G82_14935 [Burkholderiales bacterium RIFCSPLOWO2_12_FULL_67_210]